MQFLYNNIKKLLLLCVFFNSAYAENLSLDLKNVNLPDAIHLVSKFMGLNVVLSSAVTGSVSLQLHNASAKDAFQMLLRSQGLAKWQQGDILYIAPRAELMALEQDKLKSLEVENDTADLVTRVWQIRYAKAEDIARLLQDNTASLLSKRGHVRVDVRTNKLCVQDIPAQFSAITSLIQKFDIPIQQVLIEARLASVDNDFERQLGISFTTDTVAPAGHFSLAVATLADGSTLDVALAAMETEGKGELISSPSLFTANQQAASIESGEEIPYQEVSRSGGTAIAFKKAVLSLKVTPQILPDGKVLLQLQVNQDRASNRIIQGVPAITTRQITTNILIKNGQTLVLGGIYERSKEHSVQRIPFLGKIPLLGLLFQQQDAKENKRELLIFVTPKIIS